MKLAFICVNFNNSKTTKNYIKSILEINGLYFLDIIIVDNASSSDDGNSLISFINLIDNKNVKLIRSDTNLGYFKGLNLALNTLDKSDYDYVIIGNNDLTFDKNFISNLEKVNIIENIFVIAPNIIRIHDGVHQNPHIIKKFTFIQRIYRKLYFSNFYIGNIIYYLYNKLKFIIYKEDRLGNNEEQIILMGYGACYILTKHFFEKFDELDAPVFLMGEEGILANQVLSANGMILYCPSLIVNHHDHTSIGKVPSKKLYDFSKKSYQYYLLNLKHIQ